MREQKQGACQKEGISKRRGQRGGTQGEQQEEEEEGEEPVGGHI